MNFIVIQSMLSLIYTPIFDNKSKKDNYTVKNNFLA